MPNPSIPSWFVYIVRCADRSLYTGVTTDLTRRLSQHNAGTASRYTRSRRPVELAYREKATGRGAALRREAAIKRLTRQAKEQLIARRRRSRKRPSRAGQC
jgi:putative endonuclease